MGGKIELRPREDVEYVLPYLDEVERLVRVASTLPDSPDRDEVISAVLGRIMLVLASSTDPAWLVKFSSPTPGGIKLGEGAEIYSNAFELPVRPAKDLEECRSRLQQVIKGIDPGGKFLTVAQDHRDRLVILWRV